MNMQAKWLASAVAGAVMALSAGAAHALDVEGTFASTGFPPTGGASVTFELLSGGGLTTVISGTGVTFGGLYGPASVLPAASYTLPSFQTIYSFTGLAAGVYTFNLFGPVGTDFTLSLIPSKGVSIALVPEPESLALGIAGLGVLGLLGRRRLSDSGASA